MIPLNPRKKQSVLWINMIFRRTTYMTILLIILAILLAPVLIAAFALLASGVSFIWAFGDLIVGGLIIYWIIRIIRRRK